MVDQANNNQESKGIVRLPPEVYTFLKTTAEEFGVDVNTLMIAILKFGILALDIEKDPTRQLLVKDGDQTYGLLLLKHPKDGSTPTLS